MGRALLAAGIIAELNERIQKAEQNKEQIFSYIQQIKEQCLNREITYSQYETLLNQKRKGRTIQEWLDYYDSYIKESEKKIARERRKKVAGKALLIFFSLAFISLLAISGFYFRPVIIGLIVKAPVETYTQDLNLKLTDSEVYEWQLEHLGQLNSVKLSGIIEGDGEVKVYLDDILILDSNNIEAKKTTLTGALITGFAAEGESTTESYSEEQKETPQTEESPSQEESLPSETEPIPPSGEETPAEGEQPTEQPEENITEEGNITEKPEIEITIKEFSDICEETCDVSALNLNKASYTLRIDISNAKLNLNKIKYEIISEVPEIPVNITPKINITIPENITMPENITEINITEINITANISITTFQYTARIGQPVKWKKHIQLEEPGKVKI
ncbi:MAG: hypothetical protein AABX71_02405, partial [Nanoarchaeota archaeon]